MAGLWELVKPDAVDRISTHFIVAALKGRQANIASSAVGFTAAEILTALNALRQEDGKPVFTTEEQADLAAINAALAAQPSLAARQTYVNLAEAMFIAAEVGRVNEAKWRADLGIS